MRSLLLGMWEMQISIQLASCREGITLDLIPYLQILHHFA